MKRLSITILLVCSAWSSFAFAGPAEDTVRSMQQAAQKDDIEALDRHVDFDAIARASLDKHWDSFTADERSVFLNSFRTLVRRAYQKGLGGKKKQAFEFQGETTGPNGVTVKTLVELRPKEPKLSVNYLMTCKQTSCLLIDVVTDGSSLVESWRRMFNRIIKRNGKAELIARIEKKAKAGDDE